MSAGSVLLIGVGMNFKPQFRISSTAESNDLLLRLKAPVSGRLLRIGCAVGLLLRACR